MGESKCVILSQAQRGENLLVAAYLLEKGCRLALIADDCAVVGNFIDELTTAQKNRCFAVCPDSYTETGVAEAVESSSGRMGGLDVFINGLPGTDETAMLELPSDLLGRDITSDFHRLFLLNREIARYMIRQKRGSVIFLMIDDLLHYAGYPVSPVKNQGRLAFMKSMAKELTPFHIQVNALTFGMHDRGFAPAEKRTMQKKLEFCALKPPIPGWDDLLPALEALIDPPFKHMTGQNYAAAIGTSNT